MKNILLTLSMASLLAGCRLAKTCTVNSDCGESGLCKSGACFSGETTPPIDMADSGVPLVNAGECQVDTCKDSPIGYACNSAKPAKDACELALKGLAITAPKAGSTVGGSGPIEIQFTVNYMLPDGYVFPRYPTVTVRGPGDASVDLKLGSTTSQGLGGLPYTGIVTVPTTIDAGVIVFTATDNQTPTPLSDSVSITVDRTPPTLTVSAPAKLPTYVLDGDALVPDAGVIRKDETLTYEVVADELLKPNTLEVKVSLGGAATLVAADAMVCTDASGKTSCTVEVNLGPVEMNAFTGSLVVTAQGRDFGDNVSPLVTTATRQIPVTRLNWARAVNASNAELSNPALGQDGTIYVPSAEILTAVRSNGEINTSFGSNGSIGGGRMVGSPVVGAEPNKEVVFWQGADKAGGRFGFRTTDGTQLGGTCFGDTDMATSTRGGLALVGESAAAGFQRTGGQERLVVFKRGMPCLSVVPVTDVSFGTPPVANSTKVFWGQSNLGSKLRSTLFASPNTTVFEQTVDPKNGEFTALALNAGGTTAYASLYASGIFPLYESDTTTSDAGTLLATGVGVPIVTASDVIAIGNTPSTQRLRLLRLDLKTGQGKNVEFSALNLPLTSLPFVVAGEKGLLYTVDLEGKLTVFPQKFETSTSPLWAAELALPSGVDRVFSSPTLGCNKNKPDSKTGVLYFTSSKGWLISYIVDSQGLDPAAPWPKYGRDVRNSGNSSLALKTGCE